ncbi:CheY-like superfamily, partial [Cladochytrium replicatum]
LRYNMVFMDVSMPEMDGLSATRAIRKRFEKQKAGETKVEVLERQLLRPPWAWIVAFTASSSEAEKEDCMDAGMDDHVTKPAIKEALVVAMEQYAEACTIWHQSSSGGMKGQ